MGHRWRALPLVLLLALTAGCQQGSQPPTGAAPEILAEADGATLVRCPLAHGNAAYLQKIDVRRIRIDQVIGAQDGAAAAPGDYYPAVPSPRFRRMTVAQMHSACQTRYGAKAFSAVNFSFFEEYDASTRLSFPVKVDGQVVTGGSSPYGPRAAPADPYYRTVGLKALAWDDQQVTITA